MFYGPRNCMGRPREIIKSLFPGVQYFDTDARKVNNSLAKHDMFDYTFARLSRNREIVSMIRMI